MSQQPPDARAREYGCQQFMVIVLAVVVGILLAVFILWLLSSPDFWASFCKSAYPAIQCTPPTPTPYYYVPGG